MYHNYKLIKGDMSDNDVTALLLVTLNICMFVEDESHL